MELNAETKSVNEIFSPSKRYVVPRFQREYSWGNEEIEEFWDDISQQITVLKKKIKNQEYFIGCMVLVGEDSKPEYLIVDGQQRLTTLTIFLRAIIERLRELGDRAASSALYKNVVEGTDNDGKPYFKLGTESPKPYFQTEIQTNKPENTRTPTTEEENLLKTAFDIFCTKVKNFKLDGFSELQSVKALRDQVLDYLKFILVLAKNEDDAYTIFETLNARGMSLSSTDLIKNWIFKNYSITHPNDNAKDVWNDIRRELSDFSDLETFFRHYWNSKYAYASDDRLYKSFKGMLRKKTISNAKDFLKEIKEAANSYRKIGKPHEKDWIIQKEKRIKISLDLLNQYRVTQVRPFLLALLDSRASGTIGQSLFIETIANLEKFHFIFSNICQDRASGLEGRYTRAAKNLRAAATNKNDANKIIIELIKYLDDKKPTKQKILDALKQIKFSRENDTSKKTIQTIFTKIENHLQKTTELIVAGFSVEHIEDKSKKLTWLDGLGNLIPFDEKLNNEAGSGLTFSKKKEIYKNSNFKVVDYFLSKNTQITWDEKSADRWCNEVADLLDKSTKLKLLDKTKKLRVKGDRP